MELNTEQTLECKHTYHKACLEAYFNTKIQEKRFPLQCPNQSQLHDIFPFDIKKILNETDYEKYEKFQFDFYIEQHQKSQHQKQKKLFQRCLTPDCNQLFTKEVNFDKFNCPSYYKEYCLNCNCPYHTSQTWREYLISKNKDLVTDQKFQKCSKCQMWVLKTEGCNHMTCRCGYQFCYLCGGPNNNCKCIKENEAIQDRLNYTFQLLIKNFFKGIWNLLKYI